MIDPELEAIFANVRDVLERRQVEPLPEVRETYVGRFGPCVECVREEARTGVPPCAARAGTALCQRHHERAVETSARTRLRAQQERELETRRIAGMPALMIKKGGKR